MSNPPAKRVVEEALASGVAENLRGAELGEAIVKAIDSFVFHDIETQERAEEVFEFVTDTELRKVLATSYRGARWQQKVGLVLARPAAHPAHGAQVRTQLIEYGAIAETVLRTMLAQNGTKAVPVEFDKVIKKCRVAGILTTTGQNAAQELRDFRNRVHIFLTSGKKVPSAENHARKAYKALNIVLNECRIHAGFREWHFGRP